MKTIFEASHPGRAATTHLPREEATPAIPDRFLRKSPPYLPQVSELDVVRHYTRLSRLNFSIDTHFYPLGSCTMKYNPKVCGQLATLPGFGERHPLAPVETGQGVLTCLYELQEMLLAITGMAAVSLAPMAGAQGEFAGVAMMRAYHLSRGDHERDHILVPDAAHGTNPATAAMCGLAVREIPTMASGDVDLEKLEAALSPRCAGLMLTNPSTLGVFERQIEALAAAVHRVGGLLYYDGANLNAILGRVRPGEMGFDAVHLNLHKTFATPHGGGGPGAGPILVSQRLAPFLPPPVIIRNDHQSFSLAETHPNSIGPLSAFGGNVGILLRAYTYIRLLGLQGLHRVAEYAVLNANYLMVRLARAGFEPAFPQRRATHEFIITLKELTKKTGVTALDFAKRLLDHGFHAPTIYFPQLVPECLLIEPTETESRQELDRFVEAMIAIRQEALTDPARVKSAPHTMPVGRLDEAAAARKPDLAAKRSL